jgi:hypothetical protein
MAITDQVATAPCTDPIQPDSEFEDDHHDPSISIVATNRFHHDGPGDLSR